MLTAVWDFQANIASTGTLSGKMSNSALYGEMLIITVED